MATTTGQMLWYDHASEIIGDGTVDLDNHTFVMLLTTSLHTPSAGHTTEADINNEVTGNGYARVTLANTWVRVGNVTTFNFPDPVYTAAGGDIVARYYHVLNTTADRLMGYGLLDNLGNDVTTTDGNTLEVRTNASGWFRSSTVNAA